MRALIKSFIKNPPFFRMWAGGLTLFLALFAFLLGTIIILFSIPALGTAVADWVGHSRFARLIHFLY